MISIKTSGSTAKLEKFIHFVTNGDLFRNLEHYGTMGVSALASATPVDSGLTASSWTYEIVRSRGQYSIRWHNTNVVNGLPVAILIQYGHGTGTGGWVQGRDFINPVIQPIFDQIANDVWEQVRRG